MSNPNESTPHILDAIAEGIRAVQQREADETIAHLRVTERREDSSKYNAVEIGWQLLRLKAELEHGNKGKRNAAKIKSSTVELLISEGFEQGVEHHFGIAKTTAWRRMTAARNAGLTAQSTAADMQALRDTDALKGKTIAKLSATPEDKETEQGDFWDRLCQTPEQARLHWVAGKQSVLHQVMELGIQRKTYRHLPENEFEDLRLSLNQLAEEMNANAKAARADHRSLARV